jgi:hypothetical protein
MVEGEPNTISLNKLDRFVGDLHQPFPSRSSRCEGGQSREMERSRDTRV